MAHVRLPRRAGIFAAGVGSRMQRPDSGPKALTAVAGRPLIDWILDELQAADVAETVIIINEQSLSVREHVDARPRPGCVRWIVETTPSSMHSFLRVVEELAADGRKDPFLMSTVDTIAPPGTFVRFVEACENMPQSDVIFGLTTRIEEEKPLRVGIRSFPSGAGGEVVALGEEGIYASAGYYFVRPSVLGEAVACRAANLTALRLFFRHLLDRGYRMAGVCMPESIDVDRPADIDAAEALLRTGPR